METSDNKVINNYNDVVGLGKATEAIMSRWPVWFILICLYMDFC